MRSLALSLATQGFVTLRFDYEGTGDSSGGFNDLGRDRSWVASVVQAADYLRSLGLRSISAVGMRLGATLIGVAADTHDTDFSSVVLWDPCESGRSYLRELNALEALRREQFQIVAGDAIEASEFIFSPQAVEEIRNLSLSKTRSKSFGDRTLVMARNDRGVPKSLRSHLTDESVKWRTTNQQARLLDVDPLKAVLPDQAIDRIVTWLCESADDRASFDVVPPRQEAVVAAQPNRFAVNERIVTIGPNQLFGVVTEPLGESEGPLVIMLNVANEEHTGPARLWVELARRWAGYGLRCARFDMTGLGDSPWLPGESEPPNYFHAWLDDVITAAGVLSPEDPSDTVFLGLCSGAYLAIEAGLALQARGVCALNPPVSMDFIHAVDRLEGLPHSWMRQLGSRLKPVAMLDWGAATLWNLLRLILPSRYAIDLLEQLGKDEVDLFLLYTADDIAPFQNIPFFRKMDVRRLRDTSIRHIGSRSRHALCRG